MKGGRFHKNRLQLMSRQILFRNFELLEPSFGELRGGYQLLVEGDTVRELSETADQGAPMPM